MASHHNDYGVAPIPADHLRAIFAPRQFPPIDTPDTFEPEQPSAREHVLGIADAVVDFVSDVRFFAGVWIGTVSVCAGAFAWSYFL